MIFIDYSTLICLGALLCPPVLAAPQSFYARASVPNPTGTEISASGTALSATGTGTAAAGTEISASGTALSATGTGTAATGTEISASGTALSAAGTGTAAAGTEISASGTALSATGTGTAAAGSAATPAPKEFTALAKNYVAKTKASLTTGNCTAKNLGVRQSWADLSTTQRKDYLRAVNCLAKAPPKADKKLAPGLKNRLDDFTFNHINQTNLIHNDALLLPWHRAFIANFETALRTECQYKGYLPYWDQGAYAGDQSKSPVWDGSETSFGGNGKAVSHKPFTANIPGLKKPFPLNKPAGTGGGCVTDGAFKDLQLSLGPVVVPDSLKANPNDTFGFEANPRCLSRDFLQPASSGNLTWTNVTTLVQQPSIAGFRTYLDSSIHPFGHFFMGSEGADPFSTTNDPAFYLLHSQIDRLWAIWQGQDLKTRQNAIDGTTTFFGLPLADGTVAHKATLDDKMDLGLDGKLSSQQGMSTVADGRCYIYE